MNPATVKWANQTIEERTSDLIRIGHTPEVAKEYALRPWSDLPWNDVRSCLEDRAS